VGKAVTSKKAEYISCQHLSQNAITLHQMPEALKHKPKKDNQMSEVPNQMAEILKHKPKKDNRISKQPNQMPETLKHKPKKDNQMSNPLT
jgi:hypothetical protein